MIVLLCVLIFVSATLIIIGLSLAFKDMPIGWDDVWERTLIWLRTSSAKAGLGCMAVGFAILLCMMAAVLY